MKKTYITSPKDVQQPEVLVRQFDELTVAISSLSLGGAEKIVLDWATRIYPRWKVHIIVLRTNKHEWPVPSHIKVTRLKFGNIIEQLETLSEFIAQQANAICICHLLRKDERNALSMHGVRIVNVLHNAKSGLLETSDCLNTDELTIGVSQSSINELRQDGYSGPLSLIRHIPSKPKFIKDARIIWRKSWNIPENAKVIGMIGAIKSQKNYNFALKILHQLIQEEPIYLVILGGPFNNEKGRALWQSLLDDIQSLNIRRYIALPGFIQDATQCLPAFDLVLNTSHFEGLSIATLETLLSGIPIVASQVGGQGEITSEGLHLVSPTAGISDWTNLIKQEIGKVYDSPSWSSFASHRLWTLACLAKDVKPSNKTLFITANMNSGGAQRSLVNLTTHLGNEIDFEIVITDETSSSYFLEQLRIHNVCTQKAGETPWNAFTYVENIISKICDENFSNICFWNVSAKIKLLLVKALAHTNITFTDVSPGDYLYEEMNKEEQFQVLIGFTSREYFARINDFVQKFNGSFPLEYMHKQHIIQNGIPEPKVCKQDYTIKGNPKIVVNGRIAPSKFIIEIMDAIVIARTQIPNLELHIFGGSEYYQKDYVALVNNRIAEEYHDFIFLHGIDFQVQDKLIDYDAYVVLGKNQGCPNALLEALSVGMPSIANNDGGTKEQIINGETGILINSCTPLELSNAIVRIITDRSLAKHLGQNGQKHVLHSFAMETMKKNYLQIFNKQKNNQENYNYETSKSNII